MGRQAKTAIAQADKWGDTEKIYKWEDKPKQHRQISGEICKATNWGHSSCKPKRRSHGTRVYSLASIVLNLLHLESVSGLFHLIVSVFLALSRSWKSKAFGKYVGKLWVTNP